jgi:hypothetical protein
MDYDLAQCDKLDIPREEVAAAVRVGLMVNRGAESAIRKKSREWGWKGHAMTYKKTFNLNLSDIDIIELCLRKELHLRSEKYQGSSEQEDAEAMDSYKRCISEITELLGKIHNQKIWFDGDPAKPWVPKG